MKYPTLIASLLFCASAGAEIYVITDEHGHKTYTDKPPLNQTDAKPVIVTPPADNSWQSEAIHQSNDQYYQHLKQKQDAEEQEQQAAAEAQAQAEENREMAISEAERALEQAREVKAGDYYPASNNQRGLRYTQEYRQRVEEAERNLQNARNAGNPNL